MHYRLQAWLRENKCADISYIGVKTDHTGEEKHFYKIGMMKIINLIKKNPLKVEYQKSIKRNFGWNNSIKKDLKYLND